jgi:signal transduction histidine kinase
VRPLDRFRSIKLKLGIVIVTAVAISAAVSSIGFRTGIPVWARPIISASIALLLVYPFARGITSPLREMARASRAMARGDYSQPVTSTSRDEVGELARAFDAMRAQLAEVDRQRRDLVANVSHELRTPLTGLRARFENIADGIEQADPQNVQRTLDEIERLSALVDQLLDLSRIESGASPLLVQDFDVLPVLEDVASGPHLEANPVEVDAPEALHLKGDETRVHQLVRNLVENAARYSPDGAPIEVSARGVARGIEVTVADHGPGIPIAERNRVFERFYRADHGRAADDGGSGLGLAIVRSIVDAHHGTIEIRGNEPTGCRFVVTLPHQTEAST